MTTEPTVILTALGGIITAAIPLLARTFGWTDDIAQEWRGLLEAAFVLIGFLITGVAVRAKVTSVASPNLPIGTVVNETNAEPTGVVVPKPQG